MAHAEKCPVCGGLGKVPCAEKCGSTASNDLVTCHGCGGKGWVTVQDTVYFGIDWDSPQKDISKPDLSPQTVCVKNTGDTKPIREPEE